MTSYHYPTQLALETTEMHILANSWNALQNSFFFTIQLHYCEKTSNQCSICRIRPPSKVKKYEFVIWRRLHSSCIQFTAHHRP